MHIFTHIHIFRKRYSYVRVHICIRAYKTTQSVISYPPEASLYEYSSFRPCSLRFPFLTPSVLLAGSPLLWCQFNEAEKGAWLIPLLQAPTCFILRQHCVFRVNSIPCVHRSRVWPLRMILTGCWGLLTRTRKLGECCAARPYLGWERKSHWLFQPRITDHIFLSTNEIICTIGSVLTSFEPTFC